MFTIARSEKEFRTTAKFPNRLQATPELAALIQRRSGRVRQSD